MARVFADRSEALPGIMLVVLGVWLAAQATVGQLPERIQKWRDYFAR